MRTRRGLNEPPPGPSFGGPFPPGNGPPAVAGSAARTARPEPLIAANDHLRMRRAGAPCRSGPGRSGGVAKRLFERQTCHMGNRPHIDQAVLHRQAQVAVLAGLLRGDDIDALVEAVAPADIPGWFTPDVAVLQLAMSALDLASIPGSEPLQSEGLRERYLPEVEFRGRVEHRSSQYRCTAHLRPRDLHRDHHTPAGTPSRALAKTLLETAINCRPANRIKSGAGTTR